MATPNNKQGPFLGPPSGTLRVKSAQGITRVGNGSRPLTHGDSPMTPTTERDNVGVTPRPPTGGKE